MSNQVVVYALPSLSLPSRTSASVTRSRSAAIATQESKLCEIARRERSHRAFVYHSVTTKIFWGTCVLILNRTIAMGCLALLPSLCATAQPTTRLTPVTDAMLANPPPADWLMWRRTFDSWGYSPGSSGAARWRQETRKARR
jgi:hypothetical protein